MLKHIKDIRSPIAVAQQKFAARKASGDSSTSKPKPTISSALIPPRYKCIRMPLAQSLRILRSPTQQVAVLRLDP